MSTLTRVLHPALAPYVASCVGFDVRPPVESVHYGLPSPTLTVILSFDEPLDCGWADETDSNRYWMLVAGLHDAPALIRTHGYQHGLQLALTPAGARALLQMPAGALGNTLVHPSDGPQVQQALPEDLHAQLAEADWSARFDLVEQHLLQRIARTQETATISPEIAEAWRLTVASRGRLSIAQLAHRVGWSRRHLQSRWVAEFGLTPKKAARVARFDHAHQLHEAGVPLAEVAYRSGYSDQSHLNRDWRALAGQTPVQTAEEFPIVLDAVGNSQASSQA